MNNTKPEVNADDERIIDEFVDRWYLSEEGDSESLKLSSKLEMKRQMKAIMNGHCKKHELDARLNEHKLLRHQAVNVLKSAKAVVGWSEVRTVALKAQRSALDD